MNYVDSDRCCQTVGDASMMSFSVLLRRILAGLLPGQCALCASPSGHAALCGPCESDLPLPVGACCPQCADVSAGHTVCPDCLNDPPAFDASIAAWPYAFPVDHLVQALKFRHGLQLAPWFADHLARLIGHGSGLLDAIVPMPLHPARLAERGYDQAIEIARPLARRLDRPLLVDACRRTRETQQQATLDRASRRENLVGAFRCDRDMAGQTILLVDDVMTTGASAHAAALALKQAGAARVLVAVVARTHRPAGNN